MKLYGDSTNDGPGMAIYHYVPGHGRKHDINGGDCWCDPEVELDEDGDLVVAHRDMN